MATFQSAPTWADIVLYDDKTRKPSFNPIWLDWFLSLIAVINTSGGGGGAITHNSLAGLQGGTANQFFHFAQADFNALTGVSGAATIFSASINGGRFKRKQGAAVTAANNLTLGTDGDYFQVAGATTINLLDSTGFQGGSDVRLKFNSNPTVKHNQAASGNFAPIILNGAVDFATAAKNTLSLVWDSTDSAWYEIARKV